MTIFENAMEYMTGDINIDFSEFDYVCEKSNGGYKNGRSPTIIEVFRLFERLLVRLIMKFREIFSKTTRFVTQNKKIIDEKKSKIPKDTKFEFCPSMTNIADTKFISDREILDEVTELCRMLSLHPDMNADVKIKNEIEKKSDIFNNYIDTIYLKNPETEDIDNAVEICTNGTKTINCLTRIRYEVKKMLIDAERTLNANTNAIEDNFSDTHILAVKAAKMVHEAINHALILVRTRIETAVKLLKFVIEIDDKSQDTQQKN